MPYRLNAKYRPLWDATTRYIILTGGRGSGKSFALACRILDSTYDDEYAILYTRYTLTSAEVSIIPEFTDKMDLGHCRDAFYVRRQDIMNKATGARIWFRGLMQSSKNQIARLKSLHKIKTWVLDEAQELMSEEMFDTVDQSIREKDADNKVILVLNPTDIHHWIYRRFFKEPEVPDDFNGVRGNVTYIHTSYYDNVRNLSQSFIENAEALKGINPEKWEHIYGGRWTTRREGLIYSRWEEIGESEYPDGLHQWWCNDWGFSNDPNALCRMCYEPVTGTLYVREVTYRTGMLIRDVARAVIDDNATLPSPLPLSQCTVYCDPARPDSIAELRSVFDIDACPGVNRDKTSRISWLQGFNVKYVGEHIREEVQTYSWKPDPQDQTVFTDIPQDGGDHAMDAINYGAYTHLHRLGVAIRD